MLIVILIFCQGGLHDRGVHLPWGPTWWQRGGHFAGAPCTRKNKCAQTLVAGPHSRSTRTKLIYSGQNGLFLYSHGAYGHGELVTVSVAIVSMATVWPQ